MDPIRLSRAALAVLIGAGLVGGVLLGSAVTAFVPPPEPSPSEVPSPPPPTDRAAGLPDTDVSGRDFARLPRYPGSVRTEYELTRDDAYRLTAVEYFADDGLDAVRGFYQTVINDHGWQRADITYSAGEWTYLLVDGGTDALVELEVTRGLVEIDIQVSQPIGSPDPEPTRTPRPNQPVATPPPAPAPPDDDDEAEDDGGESDDSDGAGDGTDD